MWTGPAISLVVLQLLESLALLRALYVISSWRPVLLIPLTFALFTPLAVPGFAWWAAALNSLPMLAALAWVCADAILLVRTGNHRYAVTGVLVYLGGLLFFEGRGDPVRLLRGGRAAVPCARRPVSFGDGVAGRCPVVDAVAGTDRRLGSPLSGGGGSTAMEFRSVDDVGSAVPFGHPRHSAGTGRRAVGLGALGSGIPVGHSPAVVMVLGWLVLIAVLALSLVRKRRIGPVWLTAAGYAVACQVPIFLMRSSPFTALELAQTLRYFPDLVVVLALLAAVALQAPNRAGTRWLDASPARAVATVASAVLF